VPQPGSNHIQIADEVYKRIEQIKADLPSDIKVGIGFDSTQFIRASIAEVQETIVVAFFLVVGIIFLFLRDWRTTIIPVLAIPISLIGTFFFLYILDYSINVLSLLGIVLAIGLVVDDAIVVLENIYAKVEKGMNPMEAAYKGSAEIFLAVIATTLAVIAVFMPIVFLQGITGRLFREFGVTIAASVGISALVALTLTPMLSSRLLKHKEKPSWFYSATEPFFIWLTNAFANSLGVFMKARWIAFPISLLLGYGAYTLLKILPQELLPIEDRSMVRVFATAPEGASFGYMDNYVKDLIKLIEEKVPEKKALITVTSPGFGAASSVNTAFCRLVLADPKDRSRKQADIAASLMKDLNALSDARGIASQEASVGGGRGVRYPVQLVVQTSTLEKLKEALPRFAQKAGANPAFALVDIDLKFSKPEVLVQINREKANSLGVSVIDVAQTLQLGLSGQRFGYFYMDGKQYQVIGILDKGGRDEPTDLRGLFVRNNRGELIQLDNILDIQERSSPPQLYRYNRFASATVSAALAPGYSIDQGIAAMRQVAKETLDASFSTTLTGESRDFEESASSMVFAFILALVLVYLVLAAQFESFRDPFIVMFTVPLALFGALGSLWIYDQTVSIFSNIGIVMLVGLVTKNGILIVEFANQQQEAGLNKVEAAVSAARERFRPILMTALSTILGTLPIALALGAGAESRVSMGIAVVGGMLFSTFLTLYVIPALYSYMATNKQPKP
jgi:multidrug efflux pump